jgi:hypothetical protein
MQALPPFLRHLLLNLRVTVLILIAGLGAVVLYALVTKQDASWEILAFLGIGMFASSLLNAWRDAKKER